MPGWADEEVGLFVSALAHRLDVDSPAGRDAAGNPLILDRLIVFQAHASGRGERSPHAASEQWMLSADFVVRRRVPSSRPVLS